MNLAHFAHNWNNGIVEYHVEDDTQDGQRIQVEVGVLVRCGEHGEQW